MWISDERGESISCKYALVHIELHFANSSSDAFGNDPCYRFTMMVKRHFWQHCAEEVLSEKHLIRISLKTQMQRCKVLLVLDERWIKLTSCFDLTARGFVAIFWTQLFGVHILIAWYSLRSIRQLFCCTNFWLLDFLGVDSELVHTFYNINVLYALMQHRVECRQYRKKQYPCNFNVHRLKNIVNLLTVFQFFSEFIHLGPSKVIEWQIDANLIRVWIVNLN